MATRNENPAPFMAVHPGMMIKPELEIPVRDRSLLQELVRKFGWACVF